MKKTRWASIKLFYLQIIQFTPKTETPFDWFLQEKFDLNNLEKFLIRAHPEKIWVYTTE